jgi:hypothetical protein
MPLNLTLQIFTLSHTTPNPTRPQKFKVKQNSYLFLGKARKYSTIPSLPAERLIPKDLPSSAKQLVNASLTTSS